MPIMEVGKATTHRIRHGKMYRKVVFTRLLLNDYWIGVELCQDRDHLDFIYTGITPDEESNECLDFEYEKALMWHSLSTN